MVDWAIAELGLLDQTEFVNVNIRAGEQKTPAFLAVNPFGKLPAVVDGDLPLFESGAILLHLANKYGKLTPDQLGTAAQWVLFSNSTFAEAFFVRGPSPSAMQLLGVVDGVLAKNKWITGSDFSPAADTALAGYLLYLPLFFPDMSSQIASDFPHVWAYMAAAAERPTCPGPYKEAMAEALKRVSPEKKSGLLGKIFG